MSPEEFRALGHDLIDKVASLLESLPRRPVTAGKTVSEIKDLVGTDDLPERALKPQDILNRTTDLLFENSLYNGHPRFMGYITASAAPIGILADLLAAAINPNVGGWDLSPVATEIEALTVKWIAQFIGYPDDCGGILVSGGNMANIVAFFAARKAKISWDLRNKGIQGSDLKPVIYCSKETHTWIHKAAELSGMGINAVRWIGTDENLTMNTEDLESSIQKDLREGYTPMMVIGTAGSVSTGAIDPLAEIADIAAQYKLWYHVDGAYGAPAAILPEYSGHFKGMEKADSVAVDPHKWFYSPLEAGCTLVRDPGHLVDAYGFKPEYYAFSRVEEEPINFYEMGPQNSRGFRALKVWLGLKMAGKEGYTNMIREDIRLSKLLFELFETHEEFETFTNDLSITTFRFVPKPLKGNEEALDKLNRQLLARIQRSGDLFLSNAVIGGKFVFRTCIVNFRTSEEDIRAIPGIILGHGEELLES